MFESSNDPLKRAAAFAKKSSNDPISRRVRELDESDERFDASIRNRDLGGATDAQVRVPAEAEPFREPPPADGGDLEATNEQPVDDTEKIFAELAQLSPVAYDRVRKASAEKLRIRVETLDAEIKSRRPEKIASGSGRSVETESPIPCEEAVNGATLASEICATFKAHLCLEPHAAEAMTLWIFNTYVFDCFETLPILTLTSPQKRCGKTTALGILTALVHKPIPSSNISGPSMFRAIEKWSPTLVIDEADSFLKNDESLRGIINSGHTKTSAFVIRTVGDDHEPKLFSTWAPKIIAGIGGLAETVMDRSIVVTMKRKGPGQSIQKVTNVHRAVMAEQTRKLMRWAIDYGERLKRVNPDVPRLGNDRLEDNWFPLLAIADLLGGDWPTLARDAMKSFSDVQEDESNGVILLKDIAGIFEARRVSIISSSSLVDSLVELEDSPWSEWWKGKPITPRQLARLLKPFGVKPDSRRVNGHSGTVKGYRKSDFDDAFLRYLPNSGIRSGTPEHPIKNKHLNDIRSGTQDLYVPDRNNCNILNNKVCSGVPDKKVENGILGGKNVREGVEV